MASGASFKGVGFQIGYAERTCPKNHKIDMTGAPPPAERR